LELSPFWRVFRFFAPTLITGNTGLLKAAKCFGSAKLIESIHKAGVPEGVFQNLIVHHESKTRKNNCTYCCLAVTITG
jgi:succinate-semialdehyde dehydrogenase/glutarate-semialdehyde dehydrogenase